MAGETEAGTALRRISAFCQVLQGRGILPIPCQCYGRGDIYPTSLYNINAVYNLSFVATHVLTVQTSGAAFLR